VIAWIHVIQSYCCAIQCTDVACLLTYRFFGPRLHARLRTSLWFVRTTQGCLVCRRHLSNLARRLSLACAGDWSTKLDTRPLEENKANICRHSTIVFLGGERPTCTRIESIADTAGGNIGLRAVASVRAWLIIQPTPGRMFLPRYIPPTKSSLI
jgi:hypothetical protein